MKKMLYLLAIIFCTLSLFAQEPQVKFYLDDGSSKVYKIAEIESIGKILGKENYIMYVFCPNGITNLYPLITMDSLIFTNYYNKEIFHIFSQGNNINYMLSSIDSISFKNMKDSTDMDMALIPAGIFEMGQKGTGHSEHTVYITREFYMSKFEVTQKQYTDVIGSNPSYFAGNPKNPVEYVTFYDAIRFCNELSKEKGLQQCYYILNDTSDWSCKFDRKGYRLPTEAEWEYACRAGTTTDYYYGTTESQLDSAGWYKSNSDSTTHPVGQKIANDFGL
ncbi:MAG: hypothetical protein QG635_2200, partial [Bacteroidota bacterium]|nr:hypothetical protein [Bacteroidota bacterium]